MQIFFFFQKGAIFFCFSPAVSHANWIRSQMGEGLVWRVGVGGGGVRRAGGARGDQECLDAGRVEL